MPSRYPCQISSVYSGRAMRSSSLPPCASNRHSSTFVACEENNEKLTPRPSHVAPRGLGKPSLSRYLEGNSALFVRRGAAWWPTPRHPRCRGSTHVGVSIRPHALQPVYRSPGTARDASLAG